MPLVIGYHKIRGLAGPLRMICYYKSEPFTNVCAPASPSTDQEKPKMAGDARVALRSLARGEARLGRGERETENDHYACVIL
eukprot:3672001-Rhodomonas_salina.1